MTIQDATSLQRKAQRLIVEIRRGYGSPPSFEPNWHPVWGAKVDRITINAGAKPSVASIWFPELRWNDSFDLTWGDMVRIRTDEYRSGDRTILFVGFVTAYNSGFSGGTDKAKGYERNVIACQSYRWLLSTTSPVFGQIARGPDDYHFYGQDGQNPKDNSYTFLSGQRAIFNASGKPNSDPYWLVLQDSKGQKLCDMPIFTNPSYDSDLAIPWTAKDMIRYVLSPYWNAAYEYLKIDDPDQLAGLDHADWDKVLNHIVIEGLNVIEAIEVIAKQIGWSFREQYDNDDNVTIVFYKIASGDQYVRDNGISVILHRLYAPPLGQTMINAITTPIGKWPKSAPKILWSMELVEDIALVVNNPWGLGAPDRFEFTAELVPAWLDSDLMPDESEDYANLFLTQAELQEMTNPNSKDYYKYYHPRGNGFRRNVGRKWVLNESGAYSASTTYDRGMPFDFATVIPAKYLFDKEGKRLFAPFNRQLLACLSVDNDDLNSVGIVVEFSFDGGSTWQIIPAAIISLKEECGIYISEANIAEMVDQNEGTISGGELDGKQLNFWTSLCDDKLSGSSFKAGQWQTRVRVTASIQMDQRLSKQSIPSSASGSPFLHSRIYDFSQEYGIVKRADSILADQGLAALSLDSTVVLGSHLDAIRKANEDMSISGLFTLERLWLGDGEGEPAFAIGDSIEKIAGREYELSASYGGGMVFPEIIQIVYLPDKQKMQLITRDLRFAGVVL